ncbi:hypothetical protein [Filifactor villosus]|uniref:Uncharacterized protein n=1 Tax=Filifactor villosus TaxID=29374 RepID=A0ABV9QMP5_9FIRM
MKVKDKKVKICDECSRTYFEYSSKMAQLCPHCAHILYGYPDCGHVFEAYRCVKCLYHHNKEEYIDKLLGEE